MKKDNFYSQEQIYEPLNEYKRVLKDMHNRNVNDYYDNLLEEAETDVEANRLTIKELRKLEKEAAHTKSSHAKWVGFRTLLIVLTIIAFVVGIYFILNNPIVVPILIGSGVILVGIGIIVLIVKKINPKIKLLQATADELNRKIREKYNEARNQMSSLNSLFRVEMAPELFTTTLPIINLDKQFDSRRLEYLINKFGLFEDTDINRSTLYVQSGDINGNPFYISDNLYHELGTKDYTGTLTIHWTTSSVDSNGRTTVRHHTQTLVATVTKPCPYYSTTPYLIYGNEAAPDLKFTRTDSDAETMSDKQIEKHVNREIKKLKKKSNKAVDGITVLGNEEFEVLWRAHDRNNEVQFRLLFTVLAQRELLALMKDKTVGFGDDFNFVKNKMINGVFPAHLHQLDLTIKAEYFHHYDVDQSRKIFVDYQNKYFKHIYFTFAPILAIPLYQQHKPHEYIYEDLYDSYVSFYEHEKVANYIGEEHFKHPLSGTRNILKTSTVKSNDYCDYVTVSALGYETIPRVDYIPKLGRDGNTHLVPVHWIEYIPVVSHRDIEIHVPKEEKIETHHDRFRKLFEDLKDKKVDEENIFKLSTFLVLLKDREMEE